MSAVDILREVLLYRTVAFREPQALPDGTFVKEFSRDKGDDIRREPPDNTIWPAKVVITGPWGRLEVDWENLQSSSAINVPSPTPYTSVPLSTANKFIDYLNEEHSDRLIYRGVKCADTFKLIPSVQRTLAATGEEQVAKEAALLLRFYDATYEQGLTIPNWPAVNDAMEAIRSGNKIWPNAWPPRDLHEFIALAQHHLVPTRVLDWTRDPMVAAYFAARPAPTPSDLVAVWILDPTAYPANLDSGYHRVRSFITVPYDVNPNARAQYGVFTLHNPANDWESSKPPTCEPLDEFVSKSAVIEPPNGLRKVTLPRTEEVALLRLLNRRRINASTMFPGYYGAKLAADERAIWDV